MEEVYVVKVKTRPEPSKLYPSERRYSAVTVGGLGLVHALLAVTSILLASLGIVAEGVAASYGAGVALGVASSGAAVVGVLAWRRWYVDNNIRYFLVTSVISGVAAIICIVLTAIAIATMQEEMAFNRLTIKNKAVELPVPLPLVAEDGTYGDENYDELQSNNTELIEKFILAFENQQNRSDFKNILSNETYLLRLDDNERPTPEEQPVVDENARLIDDTEKKEEDEDMSSRNDEGESRANPSPATNDVIYNNGRIEQEVTSKEVRNVLSINILIASFLELAWSLLSIRIAWKGMKSDYPNDEPTNRVVVGCEKTSYLPKFMRSVRTKVVRRPDILSNHKSQPRNIGGKSSVAVISDEVEHYLPQQESTTEYHERVRKFLASNNHNC